MEWQAQRSMWRSVATIAIVAVVFSCILPAIVHAQAAATSPALTQPSLGEVLKRSLPLCVMFMGVFYVLVLLPQNKKLKTQQELLSSLKKGETVVTSSGMIGRIAGVEKDHILVEIASNVRVRFEPNHITKRVEREREKEAA